ncbi:hypothetical protein ABW19_dt0200006 [Dactylella cylindrospora]|nr:hypothetical protein ABW19_dt0200006 [Dactylella cylindrospora]
MFFLFWSNSDKSKGKNRESPKISVFLLLFCLSVGCIGEPDGEYFERWAGWRPRGANWERLLVEVYKSAFPGKIRNNNANRQAEKHSPRKSSFSGSRLLGM